MSRSKTVAPARSRTKGRPNTTASVKEALLLAHQGIGGVPALTKWARDNQTEFYKLLARLIPTEVTGPNGGPIQTETQVWQIGERTVRF